MAGITITPTQIWLIFGILMLLLEIFIPGLVIGFFGLGALITALLSWLGVINDITYQAIVFVLSSLLSLLVLRKMLKKVFLGDVYESEEGIYDDDIGKIVEIIEDIIPNSTEGKIKFKGSVWKAKSQNQINKGENAKIINKDNLTIWVEKI